jgi:hypothetical protein
MRAEDIGTALVGRNGERIDSDYQLQEATALVASFYLFAHAVTITLTNVSIFVRVTRRINLAHVKDAIRVTAAGGASAVPAGEGSSPLLSGGSGIMPAGTMTGARGARCNWVRRWRHVRRVRRSYPRSLARAEPWDA